MSLQPTVCISIEHPSSRCTRHKTNLCQPRTPKQPFPRCKGQIGDCGSAMTTTVHQSSVATHLRKTRAQRRYDVALRSLSGCRLVRNAVDPGCPIQASLQRKLRVQRSTAKGCKLLLPWGKFAPAKARTMPSARSTSAVVRGLAGWRFDASCA